MAKASKEVRKFVLPVQYVEEDVVVLELTLEEAKFLSALTSKIGGDPDTSVRQHADSMRAALAPLVGRREFTRDAFINPEREESRVGIYFATSSDVEKCTIETSY